MLQNEYLLLRLWLSGPFHEGELQAVGALLELLAPEALPVHRADLKVIEVHDQFYVTINTNGQSRKD